MNTYSLVKYIFVIRKIPFLNNKQKQIGRREQFFFIIILL